tara:strand:+ start:244 stop:633 length:390 start_codon:yes stop_codon:yes gene_type:complete
MSKNPAYKAFILEGGFLVEDLEYLIKDIAKDDFNREMETRSSIRIEPRIPRDYDFYYMHLSQLDLNDLEKLREEQPWSYIVGISGGGEKVMGDPRTRKCCDSIHYLLMPDTLKNLLKSAFEKFESPNKP